MNKAPKNIAFKSTLLNQREFKKARQIKAELRKEEFKYEKKIYISNLIISPQNN